LTEHNVAQEQTLHESKPVEVLRHVPALDGIRGLAILLVMLFHLAHANTNTPSALVNGLLRLGGSLWVGVDLFFALSGFLITGILLDSVADPHFFKNFYGRRLLRIAPLYYGFLLLLFIVVSTRFAEGPRPWVLLLLYLQNTPLWYHLPATMPLAEHVSMLWSLAVEEQFYLVWPVVIYLVRDRRKLLWIALAGAVAAPLARALLFAHGASPQETYELTICRADALLGGAWLALVTRGPARNTVIRFAPWLFWAALGSCVAIGMHAQRYTREVPAVTLYGYSLTAITGAAVIAMSLGSGSGVAATMKMPALRFLGKYSYCLYLVHQFVFWCLQISILPAIQARTHSMLLYHFVDSALVFAISIGVAMISFRFFEQPVLRLKSRFNYDRAAASPPVSTV